MSTKDFEKSIDQILAYGPSKRKDSDRIDQEKLRAAHERIKKKRTEQAKKKAAKGGD